MVATIADHEPDVIILTEFVEGDTPRDTMRHDFAVHGFEHVLVSPPERLARGWGNQVLIASRQPMDRLEPPAEAPDASARTNLLAVRTGGLSLTGLRAPYYTTTQGWYQYWAWLSPRLATDVVIGDFNTDLARNKPRDRVLSTLTSGRDWAHMEPEGPWSYRGRTLTSRLDHVICRPSWVITAARYVPEPFVPEWTDHALLVADVERASSMGASGNSRETGV